jgi:hypothetical protein
MIANASRAPCPVLFTAISVALQAAPLAAALILMRVSLPMPRPDQPDIELVFEIKVDMPTPESCASSLFR